MLFPSVEHLRKGFLKPESQFVVPRLSQWISWVGGSNWCNSAVDAQARPAKKPGEVGHQDGGEGNSDYEAPQTPADGTHSTSQNVNWFWGIYRVQMFYCVTVTLSLSWDCWFTSTLLLVYLSSLLFFAKVTAVPPQSVSPVQVHMLTSSQPCSEGPAIEKPRTAQNEGNKSRTAVSNLQLLKEAQKFRHRLTQDDLSWESWCCRKSSLIYNSCLKM